MASADVELAVRKHRHKRALEDGLRGVELDQLVDRASSRTLVPCLVDLLDRLGGLIQEYYQAAA
jgi:hypothetical protein